MKFKGTWLAIALLTVLSVALIVMAFAVDRQSHRALANLDLAVSATCAFAATFTAGLWRIRIGALSVTAKSSAKRSD